ncbi:MAG: BACON domain-containing protein [Bacteroidales bacterium]|nr:BACON domain-containing protein [Bacteroidales bacterium]
MSAKQKSIRTALAGLFAGCLLLSCNGTLPVTSANLEVTPKEVSFAAEGGTAQVAFTAPAAWSVSVSADWIQLSPSSGEAGAVVVVFTASRNATASPRSAVATISVPSLSLSEGVSLIQEAGQENTGPDGPEGPDNPPGPDDTPDEIGGFSGDLEDWLDETQDWYIDNPSGPAGEEVWYILGNMFEDTFERVYPMEKNADGSFSFRVSPRESFLAFAFANGNYPEEPYSCIAASPIYYGDDLEMTGKLELPVSFMMNYTYFFYVYIYQDIDIVFYPNRNLVVLDFAK